MSKMMQYARLTAAELAVLRGLASTDPDAAFDYADEVSSDWPDEAPLAERRGYGTDVEWAGLRHLLALAGPPPVDLIGGGAALSADEWAYEPPRLFTPAEVAAAAAFLRATPFGALAAHLDPAAMADVYPGGWADSPPDLAGGYRDLVAFVGGAADAGDSLLVWLT
ncbi:MAG TPA: DUF1877 family protein [Pilimelia sp.]|nr:DUF1877 family protein [Pilimelia sp.]